MKAVQLKNVYKNYGNVEALKGISFTCRENELLVILGPSGAGKTSTLKMIAGLEPVTRGETFIKGRFMNFVPPEKRDIAMVFETYALYPHLSVFDNIAFPLRSDAYAFSQDRIEKRVREIAQMLQIESLLKRRPRELSGGQKQRVSLGRAMVRKTEILLMDEPLSHLDAKLRHQMRRELKKYKEAFRSTLIYVTHDYLEALALADEIIILNEGRIYQVGTPDQVYHEPVSIFVASLLGQPGINLIECRVRGTDGEELVLQSEDGAFEVPCPRRGRDLPAGKGQLTVGIRPQYIRLSPDLDEPGMTGEIYVSEYLGVKSVVQVRIGQYILNALAPWVTYRMGQPVKVDVVADHTLLFDIDSGKNLVTKNRTALDSWQR